jgi:hypothetical protein
MKLCIDIDTLSKQKCLFFPKNRGQEGKIGPLWGLVGVKGERYKKKV